MRSLPLATRILLLWLVAVGLLPAATALLETLELVPSGSKLLTFCACPCLLLIGLIAFERPRSASISGWIDQLRRRLVPALDASASKPEPR